MKERRRDRRFRLTEKFKLKARVKKQDSDTTCYFVVSDLSMGGLSFSAENEDASLELGDGDVIDILLFRKNLSVRVTAQILQDPNSDRTRAKIIGINDFGREVLSGFLLEMASNSK